MNPEGRQTLRNWKDNRFRDEPEIADLVDELKVEEERERERPDDGFPEHDNFDEESNP